MSVIDFATMPTLRSLDDAARIGKVSRRLLQKWLSEGQLKRWQIPGDRKRYVDIDEVKRLLEPRPLD
jgi:predicted site-specific integrase-resolvase